MDYRCVNCQINAFSRLLEKQNIKKTEANNAFKEFLNYLSSLDFENKMAPEIAKITHDKIKNILNVDDLYKDEKLQINKELLEKYEFYKTLIQKSDNPDITALKIAIAGNIIDSISNPIYNIDKTIGDVLYSKFAIDQSNKLFEEIQKAKTVLYLGDNAGEIVLDKMFIEHLNHKNIIYAVRGGATLNDATIDDANFVDMQSVAKVITNGYDAPSTILKNCSKEFIEIYEKADLIISKGMGNLEGLLHNGNSKIFFLSIIKCDVIAKMVNVKKGDFIVMQNFVPTKK